MQPLQTNRKELPKLDERLAAAAAYVRPGRVCADIGCDHGKLSVHLAAQHLCKKVIACDIRPKPLQQAVRNLARHGCGRAAECRLGNGLSVVSPDEADDIVIAGMSGVTICAILADAPQFWQPRHRFIFVPACKDEVLRGWLRQNGFRLLDETPAEAAGRFYTAMCVVYAGKEACEDADALFCAVGLAGEKRTAAARGYLHKVERRLVRCGQQALAWQVRQMDEMGQQQEEKTMQDNQQCTVLPSEVARFGEQLAPAQLAIERDNVGLLVDTHTAVTGILCTLDITRPVIEEAEKKGCNLIVSHHPVIYRPLRTLAQGEGVYLLAQKGIAALCLHTNLDMAQGGVNDTLIALLGAAQGGAKPFGSGMGRIGALAQPVCAAELLKRCATIFGAGVRYTPVVRQREIRTIAVLGGSGGEEAAAAFAAGAQAFITGEAGYHVGVDAAQADRLLIVAGHFATEYPVVAVLAQKFAAAFPGVPVLQSETDADPFRVI